MGNGDHGRKNVDLPADIPETNRVRTVLLTVPEAAKRTGKNPETIRRWIRSGRLPSQKVGTHHLIDETDLQKLSDQPPALPPRWLTTATGEPMPDWVSLIREGRDTQ